jgi:hypothetical protein
MDVMICVRVGGDHDFVNWYPNSCPDFVSSRVEFKLSTVIVIARKPRHGGRISR